uniref:Uncharacterized protein n=1 Tax=Tanacetum cinerariifolium TaxID=118510 RepID=A0A699IBB3_TANCI|nr:hypothetical protein [Tanacetum cinerariifolium]
MDRYTKNALWVYWTRGDDEVVLSNMEVSDLKDENNNDEHKIVEVFKIQTNLFDYEIPLCAKLNEFNYLLKVDSDLFTHDIQRTETYKDYENKLNNEVDESWSEDGVPYEEEERKERCNLFNNTARDAWVCKIRRFEMIKYSLGQDEEYVAIKECEYDDLTKTNEDACRAYQEIFRSMDEGWMVTRAE